MRVPYLYEAYIADAKISGYLLADDHPTGRSKALFFRSLGFSRDRPAAFRSALLRHAQDDEVSSVQQTPFGAKYVVEGCIKGSAGRRAAIRSIWFIDTGARGPRLITAYPIRGVRK